MNRKLFKGGLLETVILTIINGESQNGVHGYSVYTTIKRKFGVRLGPSTLYPELRLLEKQRLIESFWDVSEGRPRRKYMITQEGRSLLAQYSAELRVVIQNPMRVATSIH